MGRKVQLFLQLFDNSDRIATPKGMMALLVAMFHLGYRGRANKQIPLPESAT